MRKLICLIGAVLLMLQPISAISAESAVVLDGLTGECLFAKNADAERPMASTTKIMTAIIAIETGDLDRVYTVKKEYTLVEGSSMYLREGEEITLRDTLYGLLLMSGNDAALALDPQILTLQAGAGQSVGEEGLAAALTVDIRMVKEIGPVFQSGVHECVGLLFLHVCDAHAADSYGGHLQAAFAKGNSVHSIASLDGLYHISVEDGRVTERFLRSARRNSRRTAGAWPGS